MTQSQYEVFICYETTSEFDLAVNLRESLRRVNIKAFVAELEEELILKHLLQS